MIIPIRCISCGKPIAHLWEIYQKRISSGEDPKIVLDELGLKDMCCRSVFLTHVDLARKIAKFKKI
ncbi:MAG: DNA-directed RNA polymerase subunit N [Candidatus Aenigmatarchaeota archaeon]|nr:DNA-directed RNA polymerase subunit N [Candidatus Aenigmarchaeota archaeon]